MSAANYEQQFLTIPEPNDFYGELVEERIRPTHVNALIQVTKETDEGDEYELWKCAKCDEELEDSEIKKHMCDKDKQRIAQVHKELRIVKLSEQRESELEDMRLEKLIGKGGIA